MLEPTCQALLCRVAGSLSGVRIYLPAQCCRGCRLFKWCQNLPAGLCVAGGAGCLSGVRTYLLGSELQGCRLFLRCWNLPAGHCVAGVQAVKAVPEPTCWALGCRGAGCLSCDGTFLPGTVCSGVQAGKRCRNQHAWHCVEGVQARHCCAGCLSGFVTYLPSTVCRVAGLFKQCQNLPAGHCVAGLQVV